MKFINIGILGCANIAEKYIIPTLLEMSDSFVIGGIASRSKKKAAQFSRKFNIDVYPSYEALIEDTSFDAIYIPLPNSLHAEWVEKALNMNLHVLVEKSLATSFADVQRLNKIASNNKLVLMENFQFRFHRQLMTIQTLVKTGKIGELRSIRSSFGFPPFDDINNIRYNHKLGGGALFDAGAYPVKISAMFLGGDIEIKAGNLFYDQNTRVDIWGGAYLAEGNGPLFAEIAFGFDNHYQCNVELWGSEGKILANRIFTSPPGKEAIVVLETNSGEQLIRVNPDNHFKNLLHHFYKLSKSSIGVDAEYEQNIIQSRLLHQIREKSNEG